MFASSPSLSVEYEVLSHWAASPQVQEQRDASSPGGWRAAPCPYWHSAREGTRSLVHLRLCHAL